MNFRILSIKNKLLLIKVLFLLTPFLAQAEVHLPKLFTDHMVLQQNKEITIWGTAFPGESITISLLNQKVMAITSPDGKWRIALKPMKATNTPFEIIIHGQNTKTLRDVLIGEVWVCSGQSNMDMTVAREDRYWCGVINEAEEVASANYPSIRVFDVDYTPSMQVEKDVTGKWEVCSPQTVGHFSAAAYFFAREIHQKYKIPVGLITTAYGASTAEAWTSYQALKARPNLNFLLNNYSQKLEKFYADSATLMTTYREKLAKWNGDMAAAKAESGDVTATQNTNRKAPRRPGNPDPRIDQHNPYILYNGMVAPLIPYTMRGVLWYQGESNTPSVLQYREIMETMIADWRKAWNQGNFPFIYVQLANYQSLITQPVKDDPTVLVREAQLQNLSVPNTAMVVAMDNATANDYNNIHPKNKQSIGLRLAIAAEGLVYKEKTEYMGPVYKKMKVEGNKIRIYFNHTGTGLIVKGDTLKGFAIAGSDKNWVWGNALIDGKTVVISNPAVPAPVAIRYGWAKNQIVNLYNKENLPASPFRTDN
jgi:sialate O-acetylesterase